MLLFGGIHTNIFRPKKVIGLNKERPLQAILFTDGKEQAEEAAKFLRGIVEVESAEVTHPPVKPINTGPPPRTPKDDL